MDPAPSCSPIEFAHRGLPFTHPENTIEGFVAALAKGVDGIEFDVQLAADGVPVVIHDDNLKRTHGLEDRVSDLDSGRLGELEVPSLAEVIGLLQDRTRILLEMKGEDLALSQTVARMCADCENVWLLSFCFPLLAAATKIAPARPLVLNLDMPLEAVPEEQRDFVQVLSVDRRLLLKDQVQRVQAEGKEVWAFTCNTQEEKETVRALGVNAFFTDNPQ